MKVNTGGQYILHNSSSAAARSPSSTSVALAISVQRVEGKD